MTISRQVCRFALLTCLASAQVAWADSTPQVAKGQPAAQAPGATDKSVRKPDAGRASSAEFERLLAAGSEARQAQRWEHAIEIYTKVIKLQPAHVEGHWYLGTAYYSLDNFTQCRDAFRRVTRLAPKNGAAYAFLGLCEFGLKEYDRSL